MQRSHFVANLQYNWPLHNPETAPSALCISRSVTTCPRCCWPPWTSCSRSTSAWRGRRRGPQADPRGAWRTGTWWGGGGACYLKNNSKFICMFQYVCVFFAFHICVKYIHCVSMCRLCDLFHHVHFFFICFVITANAQPGQSPDHLRWDDPVQNGRRHQCQIGADGSVDELRLYIYTETHTDRHTDTHTHTHYELHFLVLLFHIFVFHDFQIKKKTNFQLPMFHNYFFNILFIFIIFLIFYHPNPPHYTRCILLSYFIWITNFPLPFSNNVLQSMWGLQNRLSIMFLR